MSKKTQCTGCGECLNHCPAFLATQKEEYSPKAKQQLFALLDEPKETIITKNILALSSLCAGCGRCQTVCPQKLSVPFCLAKERARCPSWQEFFWEFWIKYTGKTWQGLGTVAKLIPDWSMPDNLRLVHLFAKNLATPLAPFPWFTWKQNKPQHKTNAVVFPGCNSFIHASDVVTKNKNTAYASRLQCP